MRRILVAAGAVALLALAGCTASTGEPVPGPGSGSGADPVAAATALLQERYELVRDGDYAAACELYTPGYVDLLAELAETDSADCAAVHEVAADNVAEYLATAEDQDRAGLTPFFYVPSAISVDASKITSDEPGVAIASAGAVVSEDPREFEDGVGKTPGWLSGVIYLVQGEDAVWRFAAPGEG
jgi:hypothetical protein